MPTLAPIKVSEETDALVSHTAHFLTKSKKGVVEDAVREYIDNHRDEINGAVRDALAQLDGSRGAAVAMLADIDESELDDLGGVPKA